MYKIEKIKHLLDCDICDKLLIEPVTTLCGFSVCKSHLDQFEGSFHCDLCDSEHSVPKNGFKIARRLQDALSIELSTFELTPVYGECKKVIGEAQKDVAEIESIYKDQELYVLEYFEDIKRQVVLRREVLKERIEKYSDETIESINNAQVTCQKLAKEVNKLSKDFDNAKLELNELINQFDTFKVCDQRFQEIKGSVSELKEEIKQMLTTYKSSLIDDKEYAFRFKHIQISKFFGKFEEKLQIKLDSTILDESLQSEFIQLCEFSKSQEWKLLYRASKDGFSAKRFHSKCDRIENSLTVIKSESGNVFGGYTDKAWDSNGRGVTDPNAFIFSLINKEDKPFKVTCSDGANYAIWFAFQCGPSFGSYPCDLHIVGDSNTNESSYSNFGNSYKHPDYPAGTEEAQNILAGSYKFKTTEIEIYTKVN